MFDETGAAAAKISIHLTPLCQIQHQEWTAIAENAGSYSTVHYWIAVMFSTWPVID